MTGILFIMLAATLWAADTLLRYPLLAENSTLSVVFYEHLFLVVAMAIWLAFTGQWRFKLTGKAWLAFIVIGVFGSAIGTLAFTYAFTLMNPTLVILLQKLQPIVAITLAGKLLGEPLRPRFWFWTAVCLSGTLLMIAPDIIALSTNVWFYSKETITALIAVGCALIAVIAWGCSTVFGRQLTLQGYSTVQIMSGRFSLAFVFLLGAMLMTNASWQLSAGAMPNLIGMVLLSGLLGMWFFYHGLKRIPARYGTIGELFFPVAAVLINWVFLDVALTVPQIAGAVILVLGSIMITREPREEERQANFPKCSSGTVL